MKKLFYLLAVLLTVTSCSSVYRNASSAVAKVVISTDPIPADVIVDKTKTLQGTSVTTVYFGIFRTGDLNYAETNIPGSFGSWSSHNLEKQAAIYKALDGTDFDIIVNPKYIVQINKDLLSFLKIVKRTTATVVGYGAKVKLK